ncbi:MAG TPA: hypothetical protein DCY13_18770 [Verrucomicrobiales bacterium]|nr:hypothetical protein [Verrucomicrobiales bacterium]
MDQIALQEGRSSFGRANEDGGDSSLKGDLGRSDGAQLCIGRAAHGRQQDRRHLRTPWLLFRNEFTHIHLLAFEPAEQVVWQPVGKQGFPGKQPGEAFPGQRRQSQQCDVSVAGR